MQGFITLSVSGASLDFTDIQENLLLQPAMIIRKGEGIIKNKFSLEDRWIYRANFFEEDFLKKVLDFLMELNLYREYLSELSKKESVELNCYINSEFAQFGFILSKEHIAKIHELDLNINFHILSYGMVEVE